MVDTSNESNVSVVTNHEGFPGCSSNARPAAWLGYVICIGENHFVHDLNLI